MNSASMSLSPIRSFYREFASRRPGLCYAGKWTALLSVTVAMASISPEMAFVRAISPSSAYSRPCGVGYVRIPVEVPRERLCFPVSMVRNAPLDVFLPTLFSGLIVAGCAFLLRATDLWTN